MLRYVWIDNLNGYLLVSIKVWRECYAVVWRTIYSSKFAYFGIYTDAYLYTCESITLLLYKWLYKRLYYRLEHFKCCIKNVYSSESVVYWLRYRALCTCTSLLQKRRPVLGLRLKRLYIGAYRAKFKWWYIFIYIIYIYHCNIYMAAIYIWHPYIYEFHIYMNFIYIRISYIYEFYIYMDFIYIWLIYMAPLGLYNMYIYIYIYIYKYIPKESNS